MTGSSSSRIARAAALAVWALLVVAGAGWAGTLRVPADYPSVLEAVDAAAAGDTVLVAPGTWTDREARVVYFEGIPMTIVSAAFMKAGIVLASEGGPIVTTLDGGPSLGGEVATILQLDQGESTSVIRGFTITGGGTGVSLYHPGSTLISECVVEDNGDAGIRAQKCELVLEGSDIARNQLAALTGSYYGIILRQGATIEMRGCRVFEHTRGGFEADGAPSVEIEECDWFDNTEWRALRIAHCSDVRIRDCRFARNTALRTQAGAVGLSDCQGAVEFCEFTHDTSHVGSAGALAVAGASSVDVRNCAFAFCHANVEGAAAGFHAGVDFTFERNLVYGCTGSAALWGTPTSSGCNLLWNNPDGDYFTNWPADPSDIHADPQLCDIAAGDYSIAESSPCAAENSPECGAIGALGVGCEVSAVEEVSWGRIKGRYWEGVGGER